MFKNNLKSKIKVEYLIIIALGLVAMIYVWSSFIKNESSANAKSQTQEYVENLETKLEDVLSGIKGVGKARVFLTVDGGVTSVVAKDEKIVEENGKKTTTVTTVISGGSPIVLGNDYPKIVGVLVVAKGADEWTVKTAILNAVTATLNVNCNKVQILAR